MSLFVLVLPTLEHISAVTAATCEASERKAVRDAVLDTCRQAAAASGVKLYLHDTATGWVVSSHTPSTYGGARNG